MRLYLAAPWKDKALMTERAKPFEEAGHTITWKWWDTDDLAEGDGREKELEAQAWHDYDGVVRAGSVVLFNTAKSEGKAVEQGIALGYGIPIIAIGTRGAMSLNVFHYLPRYTWVDSIEAAIEVLRETGSL